MIAAGVKLTTLFSPEHGLDGKEDRPDVADAKDSATGLPSGACITTAAFA